MYLGFESKPSESKSSMRYCFCSLFFFSSNFSQVLWLLHQVVHCKGTLLGACEISSVYGGLPSLIDESRALIILSFRE